MSWDLSKLKLSIKSGGDVSVAVNYGADGAGHIAYTDGAFIRKAEDMDYEYEDSKYSPSEDAQLYLR